MNTFQKTFGALALGTGLVLGSTAIAQDEEISDARQQASQDVIECVENNIFISIDEAFAQAAKDGSNDYNAHARANALNTLLDCAAPLVNLDVPPEVYLDENSGVMEMLAVYGIFGDIIEKHAHAERVINYMDEELAPKIEDYIAQHPQNLDL